jgi:cytochrome bd-type quinol oxidase subunit 1
VAVTAPELLISMFLFTVVYGFLGMLYVLLVIREVQRGPQPVAK